jgi:enterochelin esterase-like enzyme
MHVTWHKNHSQKRESNGLKQIFRTAIITAARLFLPACNPGNTPDNLPGRESWIPETITLTIAPTNFLMKTLTPKPSQTPRRIEATMEGCRETSGSVETQEVPSRLLPKPVLMNVYLPPCYDDHKPGGYPVLLLLHGQSYDHEQWVRLGVKDAADSLMRPGSGQAFLIAMPRETYNLQNPQESRFLEVITDEVFPWVDDHYATCTDRACRGIGGLSRGAAWAIRTGFLRWEMFGVIGGHSLPPFRGDPDKFYRWIRPIPNDELPKIYLDTGAADADLSATEQFANLLIKYQIPYEWHLNQGDHTEPYWQAHVLDYLKWYQAALTQE